MSSLSPTQRTLRLLREQGCIAAVTERWNPYVGEHGVRQDLFGFMDVIALAGAILGVQACAGSGMAAHRRKILEECTEAAEAWLRAGGRIEIWAWRKVKVRRGGKAERWEPRIENVTLEDLL